METTDKHAKNLPGISSTRKLIEVQATFARKMRKRRIALFKSLISPLTRPLNILDVGGTQAFWELMGLTKEDAKILLYNISPSEVSYPTLISMVGDARDMRGFQRQTIPDRLFKLSYRARGYLRSPTANG